MIRLRFSRPFILPIARFPPSTVNDMSVHTFLILFRHLGDSEFYFFYCAFLFLTVLFLFAASR